jgi:hypothetical protein
VTWLTKDESSILGGYAHFIQHVDVVQGAFNLFHVHARRRILGHCRFPKEISGQNHSADSSYRQSRAERPTRVPDGALVFGGDARINSSVEVAGDEFRLPGIQRGPHPALIFGYATALCAYSQVTFQRSAGRWR